MSTFARHASKIAAERGSGASTQPLTQAALNENVRPTAGTDSMPMVSPTSERESDDNSVFETAKGLAMISLEAAAEPHYIGESSGSLWTTVISRGMHTPRMTSATKPRAMRPSRSPSPSRLTVLRSQLLKPLSEELAKLVIDTVYRHLHSRVSYLC
jgi:hypothetical protein